MKKLKKPIKIALIVVSAIVFVFAALTALVFFSFVNPLLPIYETTDEDGMTVMIDGIKYKALPMLKWDVHPKWGGAVIGYAGDWSTEIIGAAGDTQRNFVYIKGTIADYYDGFLYRADKVFPEPSADSVDELMWIDYAIGGNEEYSNTITDKETIKELFAILDNEIKATDYEIREIMHIMYIGCSSSDVPGAYYKLDIGISNGKWICCDRSENEYVEMPEDLLEKIAGKKIDVDELLG